MGFLENIASMNHFEAKNFIPFYFGTEKVGHLHFDYLSSLLDLGLGFQERNGSLFLPHQDFSMASKTMAWAVGKLSKTVEMHLRDEFCDVKPTFCGPTLFKIQRGAHEFFGVKGYGVHCIAYRKKEGKLWVWVAKRSAKKSKYPAYYDDTIAGGISSGFSPKDVLLKEAWEEAHLEARQAALARSCGIISYKRSVGYFTEWATLFLYELELDQSPQPNDDEVERFELMPVESVYEWVKEGTFFKPNCNLVQMSFLIRHGILGPQEPDFEAICKGLSL
jgi:8-oxo-dGTP pyrophosphatase MutT (NUDIX family)